MEIVNQHLTRQWDIIPFEKLEAPITIIGAGAIGSFAALQLVKAGFTNLEVWDHDTVSIENMSCQFYRFKDIGKPKVQALAELIHDFTGEEITAVFDTWKPNPALRGIVVLAVDSMETRTEIFDAIKAGCFLVNYIIDPRMGAEDALMYTMSPWTEEESYRKTLYSNAEAVQERCTAKATIYTANLLSGMVAKAIKNIACGEQYPRVVQWSIANDQMQAWRSNN